ncbi:MAG: SiaB family protein kinase [Bacteroidales bacterium]|nr:SiaB family protein kinase [Bacteroidales bacterium]
MFKKIELLKYKGALDFEQIGIILDNVQVKLDSYSTDTLVKKRIYSILVEALENIYNHEYSQKENDKYLPEATLSQLGENFILEISNALLNEKIEKFTNLLEYVNNLSDKEINKSYYGKIKEKSLLEKGNAGIGIMQIAKKAKGKLTYNFKTINDKISYFTLKIII